MLQLRHVSKTYGFGRSRVQALSDVNLVVEDGTMVAVIGPSGAGKSTLLAIAGGRKQPTGGQVRRDVSRREIGYLSQDLDLLPGLTVAENVALPLELADASDRRALLAALRALDQVGLADRAGRYPGQLSGGERQLVAVARAMTGDRRLLLADEPSALSGDTAMRVVRAACRDGMTAVVVTHEARLASWADRVVFLSDGRLVDETAPIVGPETLLSGVTYAG